MAWLAVDKRGFCGFIFESKPKRLLDPDNLYCGVELWDGGNILDCLHINEIVKLTGCKMTWKDEPIELPL